MGRICGFFSEFLDREIFIHTHDAEAIAFLDGYIEGTDDHVRAQSGVYFARVKAAVVAFESFEVREARATWVLLH